MLTTRAASELGAKFSDIVCRILLGERIGIVSLGVERHIGFLLLGRRPPCGAERQLLDHQTR